MKSGPPNSLFGEILDWMLEGVAIIPSELAAISKQRNQLAHRVALLDPRHANPDLVDELVRKELGLTQPDEVIIPLN